jgi:hypothetical protein
MCTVDAHSKHAYMLLCVQAAKAPAVAIVVPDMQIVYNDQTNAGLLCKV